MPHQKENAVFTLKEYEELLVDKLEQNTAEKIQNLGIIDLTRKVSGEFVLRADSKIGFLSVHGVQVNVKPRFPIYNIFYFLGLIKELKLDEEKVRIGENDDFLTLLFQSFVISVEIAIKRGLISGYVNRQEASQVLKGRLDLSQQFRKHHGILLPLEISYDDFVEDIPENQILKLALRISLKFGIRSRGVRNQAQNLLFSFRDVSDIQNVPTWNPTRLNIHYLDSLKLARLIISGNGFNETVGDLEIFGFSIDMYKVFEDFIAKQIEERVNGPQDKIVKQQSVTLDTHGLYEEKPDLIWYKAGNSFQVIDTKYKKPEGENEQRDSIADLRQVISYASLLGLKEAHIVYGVAGPARSIKTKQEGITVYTHGLDLGLSPVDIQKQLDDLVSALNSKREEN
jgi:5-methylcytosine-specific restriction enzyme subunit McrC